MPAAKSKAPKTEIGVTFPHAGLSSTPQWQVFIDDQEHVPELAWPNSVRAYSKMRLDDQISGLLLGANLPIRGYDWSIDPNGSPASIYRPLAEDLGLPILGQENKKKRRFKRRFSFDDHLNHIFLALEYGHMFFEQVGEIGPDGLWHLRKLAPRMPDTITSMKVADDGGLIEIKQMTGKHQDQGIPVDRLVGYIWNKEGGNWAGRSMIRPLYRSWLIKDRLLRVDAMKHERNGMGIPIVEAPPNATQTQMDQLSSLAQQYKAGTASGGAVPHGAKLRLVGTEGSVPDTLASIRYHDEAMAKALLMMFMQLGQTQTGSRALGESFIDFFHLAQISIAKWIQGVFTEHVIEDWVDWNFGEDTKQAPLLHFKPSDPELSVEHLALMAEKGLITVDEELETHLRKSHRLPDRKEPEEGTGPSPAPPNVPSPDDEDSPNAPGDDSVSASRSGDVRRVEAATLPRPDLFPARDLRRQPYEQEVAAMTDFGHLEVLQDTELNRLISEWEAVKAMQIDDLSEQIAATASLKKLARVQTEPLGAEILERHMTHVMEEAAAGALTEAARQGKEFGMPDLDDARALVAARADAVDDLLARSLSEAASRKAVSLTNPVGGGPSKDEVAAEVAAHLRGLSNTYLEDQFNGALQQSVNTGRKAVIQAGRDEATQIYSSELLDANACSPCVQRDGTFYLDIEDAEGDYPTGGYKHCLGGPRCRGTLVAVYNEAEPTV